jgi:hypothetical protein
MSYVTEALRVQCVSIFERWGDWLLRRRLTRRLPMGFIRFLE